jgi:hypothetical protein
MDTRRIRLGGAPLLAVIAASVVLVAGCGGDDSGGDSAAASGGSGAPGASSDRAVKYSECMRENGVPEFPDPENGRLTLRVGPDGGIDPNSPEFKAAQEACQSLAPQGGPGAGGPANPELQDQVLNYAECMRENGVPDFPDPDVSGRGVRMQLPQGVDPNSQQFRSAQQECQSILQGLGGGAP